MRRADLTPQQRREHPDPHEAHGQVPGAVLGLVLAMSVAGLAYIARTATVTPAAWGDARERSELEDATPGAGGPVADGAALYAARCAACHQANGRGLPGVFPPLAGSEWVQGKERVAAAIVLAGVSGPMQVAGARFDGAMPPFRAQLDDSQVAAVLTHVRAQWGNAAPAVTPAHVAEVRQALAGRDRPFEGQKELEQWP